MKVVHPGYEDMSIKEVSPRARSLCLAYDSHDMALSMVCNRNCGAIHWSPLIWNQTSKKIQNLKDFESWYCVSNGKFCIWPQAVLARKGHQRHWMNNLQEVWVGQDTSEFCTYDSFYLYLCVFTHIHAGTLGGQQRASDPPELELKGVANLPRALGTEQPRSHARAASALNLCDTSLSLPQLWT